MRKTIYIFGGIAGAIVASVMCISMMMFKSNSANFDWGMVIGYASMLLAFIMIFIAIKTYRDRHADGRISFGKAFGIGLGVTCIASLIYSLTWFVIYKTVYPEFPQHYTEYSLQKMQQAGKTSAEIETAKLEISEAFEYYRTWYGIISITFIEIFPVGLLVTLICALILKRKTPAVAIQR